MSHLYISTDKSTLHNKSSLSFDMGDVNFCIKVYLQNGESGYVTGTINIINDQVQLLCPRILNKRQVSSHALKPNTKLQLIYQDNNANIFEIWTAQIDQFIAFNNNLDEYLLKNFTLASTQSIRQSERYKVSVPLVLSTIHTMPKSIIYFDGGELSIGGIGLWIPTSLQLRFELGQIYSVKFQPPEVEDFEFLVECVNAPIPDLLNIGVKVGFQFIDINNKPVSKLRIQQLIEARGQSIIAPYQTPQKYKYNHYLSKYYNNYINF